MLKLSFNSYNRSLVKAFSPLSLFSLSHSPPLFLSPFLPPASALVKPVSSCFFWRIFFITAGHFHILRWWELSGSALLFELFIILSLSVYLVWSCYCRLSGNRILLLVLQVTPRCTCLLPAVWLVLPLINYKLTFSSPAYVLLSTRTVNMLLITFSIITYLNWNSCPYLVCFQ